MGVQKKKSWKHQSVAFFITFDVGVARTVELQAPSQSIPIFGQGNHDELDDTMYRLVGVVQRHLNAAKDAEKINLHKLGKVVFPTKLKVVRSYRSPPDSAIIGVSVLEGQLRVGIPLVLEGAASELGRIVSIQRDNTD